MTYYCLDVYYNRILNLNELEICEYDSEILEQDLKRENLTNALDLTDYDRIVFDDEKKAEQFLSTYKETFLSLDNSKMCKRRDIPTMLYKRRYLVQSLMGFKMQTYRNYKKKWKIGQLFNLYDQTYFLTVKLTDLFFCEKKRLYCYKFELVLNNGNKNP